MESHLKHIGYDAKKMPLGKLSQTTIQKGFQILNKISNEIKKKGNNSSQLQDLSSEFYSNIPHDFGFQKMSNFVIKEDKVVKQKIELLESLRDMQIA